jgi:hypothetical protein
MNLSPIRALASVTSSGLVSETKQPANSDLIIEYQSLFYNQRKDLQSKLHTLGLVIVYQAIV